MIGGPSSMKRKNLNFFRLLTQTEETTNACTVFSCYLWTDDRFTMIYPKNENLKTE